MSEQTVQIEKVQHIELKSIKPDKNQPRKTFNEQGLNQLCESIKEHGVIQPITVRPLGKGFSIIMGERRFRASKMAGLKTIPSIVRIADTSSISELQIIENLQREDIDPIEEAEAIEKLLDTRSAEEISIKIGRTKSFVQSRIRLGQLIDPFKEFIRSGKVTLSLAYKLAAFEEKKQLEILDLLDDNFSEWQLKSAINDSKYDLEEAPFDLTDKTLWPQAGSCTTCPFNSINQGNLFGNGKQVCSKNTCFLKKKISFLEKTFDMVKKTGELLILDTYNYNADSEHYIQLAGLFKENGLEPFNKEHVEFRETPRKPTKEYIREQYSWYDEDEIEEELKDRLERFPAEVEEHEENLKSGYKKSWLLNTRTYGVKEIIAKKREIKDQPSKDLSKKKMDECTPKEKAIKMTAKAERKHHIEQNKEFVEIVDSTRESKYQEISKELSHEEMVAFCYSLYENVIGWSHKDDFPEFNKSKAKTCSKRVQHFTSKFEMGTFNKLARCIILKGLDFGESNHMNSDLNHSFYLAAYPSNREAIDNIENEYLKRKDERDQRLKSRLEELEN